MSNLVLADVVRVEKEEVIITSDVVAKTFKKQHKNVLRDIEVLIQGSGGIDLGFEECAYLDGKGRNQKQYTINRDGFMLLVFGFTGEKAKEVKLGSSMP